MTNFLAIRRLAAFAIDYLCIAAYIGCLTFVSMTFLVSDFAPPDQLLGKLTGHLQGFILLTLPVWLYFTLQEHSSAQATFGKRALKLRVEDLSASKPGFARSAIRNAIRFLPWEIAHAAIWYVPGRPFFDHMPVINLAICSTALIVALGFVVFLFVGSGRTPYDFVAGTKVSPSQTRTN